MARLWLEKKGFIHIASNVRVGHDEIDLLMKDGSTIVFVEVKLRRDGSGLEAVDAVKRRHLSRAAVAYLAENGLLDCSVRFDVVAVQPDNAEIKHIMDAFPLSRGKYFV